MLAIKETQIDVILQFVKKKYAVIVLTDTVWGLLSTDLQILYDMKRRPLDKPIVRLVSSTEQMHNMLPIHQKFIKKFWPGPVTVIKDGISYRMPKDELLLKIIRGVRFKDTVFCTSANMHGGDPIEDFASATEIFNEWTDNCVFIIPKRVRTKPTGQVSTIVDIDSWKIIRRGSKEKEINLWIYKNVVIPYKRKLELTMPLSESINGENDWLYNHRYYLFKEYESSRMIEEERKKDKNSKYNIFSKLSSKNSKKAKNKQNESKGNNNGD